jgi:hypothetical protein
MATYQASHTNERSKQLMEIMERRPELPRNPEKAMQSLLWEKYEHELKDLKAWMKTRTTTK